MHAYQMFDWAEHAVQGRVTWYTEHRILCRIVSGYQRGRGQAQLTIRLHHQPGPVSSVLECIALYTALCRFVEQSSIICMAFCCEWQISAGLCSYLTNLCMHPDKCLTAVCIHSYVAGQQAALRHPRPATLAPPVKRCALVQLCVSADGLAAGCKVQDSQCQWS